MTQPLRAPQPPPAVPAGLRVRVDRVSRTFDGTVAALAPLSLDIPSGQFVSILGPSGCGKSTLLRLIAGLDQPSAGTIALGDTPGDASADEPRLAYVFQDPHLMPWRRLLSNVALPLELRGLPRKVRHAAARAAISRVELSDAVRRYPAQLSGGMRMRASLARALVTRPRLLLLDEPFAALDELTRHHLHEQLLALWRDSGMTVLFVTHSVAEAAFLSQRAIVLTRRPGRIILDEPVDLPPVRCAALRATPQFAAACTPLFTALERGDA